MIKLTLAALKFNFLCDLISLLNYNLRCSRLLNNYLANQASLWLASVGILYINPSEIVTGLSTNTLFCDKCFFRIK